MTGTVRVAVVGATGRSADAVQVDSDPGTWSSNDAAKGVGFCTVQVVYEK